MKTKRFLPWLFTTLFLWAGFQVQSQTITSLTLVNSASDSDIRTIGNGGAIDLATDGTALNIRANVSGTVGSVKFEYDEANIGPNGNSDTGIESVAPYAMRGDNSGDYKDWTPSSGSHTLTVAAYTEASAGGTAGTPYTINFTVVNDGGGGGGGTGYDPPADPGTGAVTRTGELKKWHKITLDFDGPTCNETDNAPNPFLDYRLNVTFTNGSKTYIVPGYFAADGDAAESSASSGNVWRVHFTPDATGTWNWEASFRIGQQVAISLNAADGTAVTPIDGKSGSFTVGATDKSGRDLRAKGRLEYVGEHYLRWAETGEYFIKGGPDAPENMLAYEDFDGNFKSDGKSDDKVKSWSPHLSDWNTGDPSWQSGKGKEIIGAVNYLASEGLNAFSFLTMNINGDDKNVFPYVSYSDYQHMDCSKLDQWGILFDHAMTKGMYLHFKTQETENETLLDGGATGVNRKFYYRELVARYGYHLALNWNLGEENSDQTDQQRKDMAQYFYDIDPYHHNIVIHTYPGQQSAIYTPLLGNASKLTGASVQTGWNNVHSSTSTWVTQSAAAGKKWVVANDEQGGANIGVPHDDYTGSPGLDDIRKQTLWGNLMAGGAGVEYYFGYSLPESDLTCEDYRSRDISWDYVRYAIEFFDINNIPFWQMTKYDGLTSSGWCYAQEGQVYLVYLPNGGSAELTINTNATFNVKWYDPRNGGALQNGLVTSISGTGSKSLGNAPNSTSEDWLVVVTNAGGINLAPTAIADADATSGTAPVTINFDASASDDSDGTIVSYSWDFGDGNTGTGAKASNEFTTAGTYEVILTVEDNDGESSSDIIYIEVTTSGGGSNCGSHTEMMSKDFPLGGFYLDTYTGQEILAITPGTAPATATTEMAFTGESCEYDITFHGVGENDGQSSFKLYVNGSETGRYTLPLSAEGYEFGSTYNMNISNVTVNNGDIIKVEGTTGTDGSEWSRARWLKVEFNPVGGGSGGGAGDCDGAPFEEIDNIVVVEVESVIAGTGWTEESSVSGYTGASYYKWTGGDKFNNPGSGTTEYKIKINNPGTYHFRWHNKIMHGTNTTESNDSWLRIPDADDFFAKKNTSIKYPKGGMFVQSSTIVNGASSDGWMKVYCSGTTSWTWSARTSDNDAHEIYATFNNPGVYTVQISGRSNHHAIDRFVLFKDSEYSVSEASNKSLLETLCTGSSSPKYNLFVNSGSGDGSYYEGASVTISANIAPSGKVFDSWTGDISAVADVNSASTSLTMPASDVTVTAFYKDIPKYALTVENGSGDGDYVENTIVTIEADAAPSGKVFDAWTGDVSGIADVYAANTTITIPGSDASVTASYKDIPAVTHTVTFIAKDKNYDLIGGVVVEFANKTLVTEANGEAVFTMVEPATDMDYTATLTDHQTVTGTTDISSDRTIYVIMKPEVSDPDPTNISEEEQGVKFYPNPAVNVVKIENLQGAGTINIVSIAGKIVKSQNYNQANETIYSAEIPSGMYLIIIENTTNRQFSGKLIVQ